MTLAYSALVYRLGIHPRLEFRPGEIVVINPVRTRRIPVGSIDLVGTPGYRGLPIRLDEGSTVMVAVGQKTNVAAARGVRRHADDLADAIAAHVVRFKQVPADEIGATPQDGGSQLSRLPPFPPTADPHDRIQADAYAGLGRILSSALDVFGRLIYPQQPSVPQRLTFQYSGHAANLLGYVHWLLRPRESTFTYAEGASMALRGLVELHARQLAVWSADSPPDRLREILAESLGRDLRAVAGTKDLGVDVSSLEFALLPIQQSLGQARAVNVTEELRNADEGEILAVYQWESGQLHLGAAAVMSRSLSISEPDITWDVAMVPVTLWRVGQLTWASYGVFVRSVTHMAHWVGVDVSPLLKTDREIRDVVRAAALRDPLPNEPPCLPYGQFAFPAWAPPTQS
jgi:hypothetical protein